MKNQDFIVPIVAVVHDRKNRGKKDKKEKPVEIRVSMGGVSHFYHTGVRVLNTEWSAGHVFNRVDAPELNERISVMRRRIEKCINARLEEGVAVSFDDIKLSAQKFNQDSFIDFVALRMEKRNVGVSTQKKYRNFYRKLVRFGGIVSFGDLTAASIMEYDAWLRTDGGEGCSRGHRALADAGVYNHHKVMKAFISDALIMGKIKEHPYHRLPKGFIRKGECETVEYLTDDEMRAIESVELDMPCLERARDLFVFQMYTGLSYADTQVFDFGQYNIQDDMYVCNGRRVKTGISYVTVLLPAALAIVRRYGGCLPMMCNTDYNKFLKIIGAKAGIKKRMHSHLARHSFATYMLSHGSSLHHISRMLGHTNVTQTQRYAKTLEAEVINDFKKMM